MNTRTRTLVYGILVMFLLVVSSSPTLAADLPGANRAIANSAAVNATSGESILGAPRAAGVYHVTGWLINTHTTKVIVFLEKYDSKNRVWCYKHSRTLYRSGAFGFYDLEYGKYRVRTFRPGVYRYSIPNEFNAGHRPDGTDVYQYVKCTS
ncbi:MAG: hypothetical protein KKA73_22685 [Chloroflexi bacterium]|nr:hypothetical protein [Chloroflexota bacterium]MBU1750499.1 hypothetical protein [Chloroflexota bacterium]